MTDFKAPSPEAIAVRDTLKEVESAQYILYCATKRHHKACSDLACANNLDPKTMFVGPK
jgi:hypothetical protein